MEDLLRTQGLQLNAAQTLARAPGSENAVILRSGAMSMDQRHFELSPRIHTVTVLVLVPVDPARRDDPVPLQYTAYSRFLDAREGKPLPERDLRQAWRDKVRGYLAHHAQTVPDDRAIDCMLHAESFEGFAESFGERPPSAQHMRQLWTQRASWTQSLPFNSGSLKLEPWRSPRLADELARPWLSLQGLDGSDGRAPYGATLRLSGSRGLLPGMIERAFLSQCADAELASCECAERRVEARDIREVVTAPGRQRVGLDFIFDAAFDVKQEPEKRAFLFGHRPPACRHGTPYMKLCVEPTKGTKSRYPEVSKGAEGSQPWGERHCWIVETQQSASGAPPQRQRRFSSRLLGSQVVADAAGKGAITMRLSSETQAAFLISLAGGSAQSLTGLTLTEASTCEVRGHQVSIRGGCEVTLALGNLHPAALLTIHVDKLDAETGEQGQQSLTLPVVPAPAPAR